MKLGRQRSRMEARTRARTAITSINMVSLLDIFTILLLFLLVQAGDPQENLPVLENIHMPWSQASTPPKRTLVVAIERERILVEGKQVATVADVIGSATDRVSPLAEALAGYLQQAMAGRAAGDKFSGNVTIMGDREIPFLVLKRVMFTCANQHFGHISLAMQQRDEPAG